MQQKSCSKPIVVFAILTMALVLVPSTQAASNERVLYSFKGGLDGMTPVGTLAADAAGNLYGVTLSGGTYGGGTVFKLTPSGKTWKGVVLHAFGRGNDGVNPYSVTLDSAGNVYGVTAIGGGAQKLCSEGCGTVLELTKDSRGKWSDKIIHRFRPEQGDGAIPEGALILDATGNIYGTTIQGGTGSCNGGCGSVFEMSPAKGNGWNERVLYSFAGGSDGSFPYAGPVFDPHGSIYGTTYEGGAYGYGTVFRLVESSGQWTEEILYSFGTYPDGEGPGNSPLILDKKGNLYGTTAYGGSFACGCCGCGTVFALQRSSRGEWPESILHDFSGGKDDRYPFGVIFDEGGDLYGTTSGEINGQKGTVFELVPSSGGQWKIRVLYGFRGGNDGKAPSGGVVRKAGKLYGVAAFGGDLNCGAGQGCGVVFEVSP
jgi:uncharacterized repeat protein (TIGR03803 family)